MNRVSPKHPRSTGIASLFCCWRLPSALLSLLPIKRFELHDENSGLYRSYGLRSAIYPIYTTCLCHFFGGFSSTEVPGKFFNIGRTGMCDIQPRVATIYICFRRHFICFRRECSLQFVGAIRSRTPRAVHECMTNPPMPLLK